MNNQTVHMNDWIFFFFLFHSQHIRGIKQKELQIKLKAIEAQKAKASTAKYLKATLAK